MQHAMLSEDAKKMSPRTRARSLWKNYVEWGATFPDKRRAMSQLLMSEKLTAASRSAGNLPFADFNASLAKSMMTGVLRDQPASFVFAILRALAETTMEFMVNEPRKAAGYRDAGFEAFWKAIAK